MKANRSLRTVMYILLGVFSLLLFYAIFNTGNPNSVFRLLLKDTSYDLVVTLGLGLAVGALVILITVTREESGLNHLLKVNTDYIRRLRSQGRTDAEVADSFLAELGSKGGVLHSLAKRRVLRYLSRLK